MAAAPAEPARKITPCTECGKCCTTWAIEIDEPNKRQARHRLMLWYLYHERISPSATTGTWWAGAVRDTLSQPTSPSCTAACTPCVRTSAGTSSEKDCEVNSGDDGETYRTPAEFLEHMRLKRPRIHAKLAAGFARPEDLQPAAAARRKLPLLGARLALS